jgi:hypothetical protein
VATASRSGSGRPQFPHTVELDNRTRRYMMEASEVTADGCQIELPETESRQTS